MPCGPPVCLGETTQTPTTHTQSLTVSSGLDTGVRVVRHERSGHGASTVSQYDRSGPSCCGARVVGVRGTKEHGQPKLIGRCGMNEENEDECMSIDPDNCAVHGVGEGDAV